MVKIKLPLKPAKQLHLNEPSKFVHVPFLHKFKVVLAHSSTSMLQFKPWYPVSVQSQV